MSQPTPLDVWNYYIRALEAFSACHGQLLSALRTGAVARNSAFYTMNSMELDSAFENMSEELGLEVALALVAAIEAMLMLDYQRRAQSGPKDALQVRMLVRWKRRRETVRFDEVLEAWKEAHPAQGEVIGRFKQVLDLRHWVAHGRYWPPLGFSGYDAYTVAERAQTMQRSFPGVMPSLITW